jgi:hypothetical protein
MNHPAGGASNGDADGLDFHCPIYPVCMRRLLIVIALVAFSLDLAVPAMASNRVPAGVRVADVTISFPPRVDTRRPVRRVLTSTAAVSKLVNAIDALPTPKTRGIMCPMVVILGPELTVVFRAGPAGPALAETQVAVSTGTHGDSGSNVCSPIRFSARGKSAGPLVGNSYVRLVGRLSGVAIS